MISWDAFERGSLSADQAFEAFTAQLFERRIRRDHGDKIVTYVLHGAGGDGGVEAFATLHDQSVVGLQAKWFLGNLSSGRVRQIQRSIGSARARHPTLNRYLVALPENLTAGTKEKARGAGNRSGKRGGVERWEALEKWTSLKHPGLLL